MIAERVAQFRRELAEEMRACGRAGNITLVAVAKKQPVEAVAQVVAAGIHDIGENYVQEARTKFPQLPLVRKHFVGHLQTNKAKAVVETFDLVQSVDRLEAGVALARAAALRGKRVAVLIQLNVSPTERFGVEPSKAERLAAELRGLDGIDVEGVMAIGPLAVDRVEISRAFEVAAKTFACVGGSTLSMGMTGDWREAVRAGSTMLRIGTAIFGPRAH